MSTTPSAPTQAQIEAAVEQTLVGWGAELDAGQKFWWMDWKESEVGCEQVIQDECSPLRVRSPTVRLPSRSLCQFLASHQASAPFEAVKRSTTSLCRFANVAGTRTDGIMLLAGRSSSKK